jgi:hypothetical protein
MPFPERVFLIVVETEGGRDPDRMPLLIRNDGDRSVSPVFSSMQHATTFLARAQELGHHVKLDYIFPADADRLTDDFPGQSFRLDPSPDSFFPPPLGEGQGGGS